MYIGIIKLKEGKQIMKLFKTKQKPKQDTKQDTKQKELTQIIQPIETNLIFKYLSVVFNPIRNKYYLQLFSEDYEKVEFEISEALFNNLTIAFNFINKR